MALEFCGVSHRFGPGAVLREVSLKASAAEITCVLGPSGSGKSTLLRLAAGLEPLQAGDIRLDGAVLAEPGREPRPEERPVGLVFQDHALFPHLTTGENIAFGISGVPRGERQAVVRRQLEAVALAGFAGRYPHTLSGGQQQRVALARALAPAPRVVLLDEPFANVDATLRRTLREDARRALRAAGSVAVVVTHDPDEALELADRIVVLEAGKVVQAGSPLDIWRRPASVTVAELFGQAQHLLGTVGGARVRTAFGDVGPATGEEGAAVDVVVRPTAVTLRRDPAGARVVDIRFLGDRYLVLLEAAGETLRANVPGLGRLALGDRVAATFEASGTFLYGPDRPASPAGRGGG